MRLEKDRISSIAEKYWMCEFFANSNLEKKEEKNTEKEEIEREEGRENPPGLIKNLHRTLMR